MASHSPRPLHRAARRMALCAAIRASLLPAAIIAPLLLPARVHAQAAPAARPAAPIPAAPRPTGPQVLEGLPIIRVEIVGNSRTETRLILDQTRAQAGQPYSQALVDVDTKAIAALDRFVTVRPVVEPVDNPQTGQLRGVIIRFIVEERAPVIAVEISGNRKFTDAQIREGLLMRAGSSLDAFRIETDRKFILDKYRKLGYSEVAVDVDDKLLKEKGIVRYQIIEGPASKITAIVMEGNNNLKTAYIKWRIQTKTYFWILRKGLLNEEQLQQDVATIRDMYLKRGFLDARVSYSLDYSENKTKLTVRFIIIEGMRYRIGKMNLAGNNVFAPFELLGDISRFGPGSFAERDRIDALQKKIEDVYGHNGYIYRNVEVATAFTETPGIVDLNINITEGTPFVVGRVIVRGNGNVQDRVIRRQMRIYPDQTYDLVLVRKSIERLKAAHIFEDVKVTPINAPGNPPGVQDALVEVTEGQTGKYLLGAGVSTNSGLVGQISLEQQNFDITNPPHSWNEFFLGQSFKGAGQFFRILLEPGTEFQRYRVTFEEPYLFDTPYSFGNDIYYFTRSRESWDERRIGDIATLGRRFGDIWGVSLAFRGEQVTILKPQDLFSDQVTQVQYPVVGPTGRVTFYNDTAQEILDEVGSHFLTSIKPAIVRDTTDSRTFPTTGTRSSFAIEQYGAMGGDVTMTKFTLGFDWFTTVYTDLFDRKTVFSLRNEIGLIPFGTSPTYERFYLGGIGELRGFRFRGISPRSGPLQDPIGGDFSWASTAELNFPVYEEFLRGVVFIDVGTVESDITISQIRSDAGLGVRVALPFFGGLPLAVDFAFPTTKYSGDKTQFLSVSLGASF